MKRYTTTVICLAAILCAATLSSAQEARACSSAMVRGAWAYTETGSVVHPVLGVIPAAAMGRYTFDETGTFTGTQYSSTAMPGDIVKDDAKEGEYTVEGDCTGTLTLRVYDPTGTTLRRTSVWAIVLEDNGTGMRGIMRSLVLPIGPGVSITPILTFSARKIFPGRAVGDQQQ